VRKSLNPRVPHSCTGRKTHRGKLPTSHLLDGERQVSPITRIRMQIIWAQKDHLTTTGDLRLHGQTRGVVRRGPGIVFHTGRRVKDWYLKGPGPNQTSK